MRTVKARKDHKCDYCGYRIDKGEHYLTWTLMPSEWDGDGWYTGHAHDRCYTVYIFAPEYRGWDGEFPDQSEFRETLKTVKAIKDGKVIWR